MVFSSLLFILRFLPLTLFMYYLVPRRLRNLVLFIASIIFYAWGEPVCVVLILFSTLTDYITGRTAGYYIGQGKRTYAKMAVAASACINLALLAYFKYIAFFLQTIHTVFAVDMPEINPALPIGISFYTFQTMSYTIDVYRQDAKVQKNLITFGAYVALFPQLIAGPIVRYKSIAQQLDHRRESIDLFFDGIMRFTVGLGKKVLLANQIGMVWNEIAAVGTDALTTAMAWLGAGAFTLQIYFDFSGYSDMAIGLGKMFGFTFEENFNYPYESKSITEFWRRWHISLGSWFREYVYIPLGGNRKGILRQILNLAIVWFLTGLWHGAYWNFVLWGVYYGVLLIIEKLFLQNILEKLPSVVRHFYLIIITVFGFSIFSYQDMSDGPGYMQALLFHANAGLVNRQTLYLLTSNIGLFLIGIIGCTSFVKRLVLEKCLPEQTEKEVCRRNIAGICFFVAVSAACFAMLVNSSYNPFLYFRF